MIHKKKRGAIWRVCVSDSVIAESLADGSHLLSDLSGCLATHSLSTGVQYYCPIIQSAASSDSTDL